MFEITRKDNQTLDKMIEISFEKKDTELEVILYPINMGKKVRKINSQRRKCFLIFQLS